jgi:hypothetical protein
MTAPSINDKTEIVRKRRISIKTPRDILTFIEQLTLERAQGRMIVEIRPGGIPTALEFEERDKWIPLDTA